MQEEKVTVEQLRIALDKLVPEGDSSVRKVLYEEPYSLLPRDPTVSINVYLGVIKALTCNSYHFHNGTSVFVVLQGRISIEFEDETKAYSAGDVYVEPIGKVHRACNPDPDVDFICVGFNLTAPEREMVVNVGADQPPWG